MIPQRVFDNELAAGVAQVVFVVVFVGGGYVAVVDEAVLGVAADVGRCAAGVGFWDVVATTAGRSQDFYVTHISDEDEPVGLSVRLILWLGG